MTRSEKLEPVLEAAQRDERAAAELFALAEQRVTEAERKLAELQRYEQEYRDSLRTRTAAGIGAAHLRDFHAFIGRLAEAITQQGIVVERAREERDALRQRWLATAQRARAVAKVIQHAGAAESRERERREQSELDERAQRAFVAGELARRPT